MIHTLYAYYVCIFGELEFWIKVWEFRHRKARPPCSLDMRCECQRRNCPYRQTSTYTMWRKIKTMKNFDEMEASK